LTTNNGPVPTIRLYETQTWREDRRLIGHTAAIQSLTVSPDGTISPAAVLTKPCDSGIWKKGANA
jgi:WD40 repeat protein